MASIPHRLRIGPADHGRPTSFEEYIAADFEEAGLYELARGVVLVTDVPHLDHGMIVMRLADLLVLYRHDSDTAIAYRASRGTCAVRLPGMQSSRCPDHALYLMPPPRGEHPWTFWTPEIVIEIVDDESRHRDYVEKREEYLRAGVAEYWIIDPRLQRMIVHRRAGDIWKEILVPAGAVYRTHLLPGLEVRPAELLGE